MAGMLPGVEAARRRRFHQTTTSSELNPITTFGSTRRSSFCLYASSHEHLFTSTSSMQQRNQISVVAAAECDESRLGAAAREAKKRLDERLQPTWSYSHIKRSVTSQERLRSSLEDRRPVTIQADERKLKRSGSKKSLLKLSWKSSEQEECAVCLEQLKKEAIRGETVVMQLPCGHKFHTKCLVPWLVANSHCPCCRTQIPSCPL